MLKATSTETFDFPVNGRLTLHLSPEGVEVDVPTANLLKARYGPIIIISEIVEKVEIKEDVTTTETNENRI